MRYLQSLRYFNRQKHVEGGRQQLVSSDSAVDSVALFRGLPEVPW